MNQKFQPGTPVILDFRGQQQIFNIKLKNNVSPEDIIFKVIKYEDSPKIYWGDKRKDVVKCEVISDNEKLLHRGDGYNIVRNRFCHHSSGHSKKIIYVPEIHLKLAPGVDLEEVIETWDEIFDI
jgi:hypothetical protein